MRGAPPRHPLLRANATAGDIAPFFTSKICPPPFDNLSAVHVCFMVGNNDIADGVGLKISEKVCEADYKTIVAPSSFRQKFYIELDSKRYGDPTFVQCPFKIESHDALVKDRPTMCGETFMDLYTTV